MTTTCAKALLTPGEPKFALNSIVRGINAGVFVVLDRRVCKYRKMWEYVLKEVNPANLSETAPGHISLHEDCVKFYH